MSDKVIWVFNQFAGTPESGFGERHYYFSRYWIQNGYRVVIFSGSFNHMFKKLPEVTGKFTSQNVDGLEFCWVKVPKYNAESVLRFWSMLVFSWQLLFADTNLYGKPNTIIVSSMPIFPIWTALLLRFINKCNEVVFEIRDIWPLSLQYLANVSALHPAVLFIGFFEKLGYSKSNKVVSLLPNAQQHMEKVAGKPIPFYYIPNGIEKELLIDEPLEYEISNLIPKGKFIIGYTGTMALANALETFIEAAVKLHKSKDIHFVLVGDGYLKEKLIEIAKDVDNVTFIPKIRKNQVQAMIKYFDVCFVGRHDSPLFAHGVSANKYFDYMLAGKPILDANNLIKDPVELSGGGIIVKPESAEAIIDGINKLKSMSQEERNQLGAMGKKYVEDKHSIKNLAKQYLEIIEE